MTEHESRGLIFPWDASFLTHVDLVDEQHQRLITLINDLSRRVVTASQVDLAGCKAAAGELIDYASYHFEAEEQVMISYGVDKRHRARHVEEHRRFLEGMPAFDNLSDQNPLMFIELMVDYLVHWLAYHILQVDQSMARQIHLIANGASPEAAYDGERQRPESNAEPLIRALKTLLHELSKRNHELRATNEGLETAVHERTKELEQLNRHLQDLSTHDELTGLANRRLALNTVEQRWAEYKRYGVPFSVIMLDADGFKSVNDRFGHHIGDEVLKVLASRLTGVVRGSDTVARLGGDEFLILCPHTGSDGAIEIGRKIVESKAPALTTDGLVAWDGSVSVGIAVADHKSLQTHEDLIKAADEALYQSKRNGKDRYTLHGAAI